MKQEKKYHHWIWRKSGEKIEKMTWSCFISYPLLINVFKFLQGWLDGQTAVLAGVKGSVMKCSENFDFVWCGFHSGFAFLFSSKPQSSPLIMFKLKKKK